MLDELTFWMGKFPAILPTDRRYARNHMWCQPQGELARFGFSSYAVRLMQDVYFLDWHVSAGDVLVLGQEIGHIETSKAVSDLFAPAPGTLVHFNPELLSDPSGINVEPHGTGWLFEMQCDLNSLMTPEQYHAYLTENWEKTQRLIKGKINEDA